MEEPEITERGHTAQNSGPPKKPRRRWTPARILFATLLLLALIAGLAIAGAWFLLSPSLTLYIAAPLAFVVLAAGLYLAYRSFSSSLSKAYDPVTDPDASADHISAEEFYQRKAQQPNFQIIKIALFGDKQVGKTVFLTRYLHGSFTSEHKATIGVDFQIKVIQRTSTQSNLPIKLQIWDTSGQYRFVSITQAYIPHQHGFMVMYDITNRASFEEAKAKVEVIKVSAPKDARIMLVGCKLDLATKNREDQVTTQEAQEYAQAQGLLFTETSAKTGEGIDQAFESLVNAIDPPEPSSSHSASARRAH